MAHILIVDDARFVRAVLARMLARAGHTVEQACDGLQALDFLKVEEFDVILVDLDMPVCDGFDLMARMAESKVDAKVIVMTGQASNDSLIYRCRQLGASGHLSKPAYGSELLAMVSGVLAQAS